MREVAFVQSTAAPGRFRALAPSAVVAGELLAIVALQILVSLPGMATRTLWLDEAYSAVTARGSLSQIRAALLRDNGPILHYALLHVWQRLWGESLLAMRSLSLLFAVGTTILLYRFARATCEGRSTARLAAVLWALNPLTVFYANQVRMYTGYAFFGMAFLSALILPSRRSVHGGVLLGVGLAMLVYTHNGGWLFAAAALLATFVTGRRALGNRWTVAGIALGVAAYVPWVGVLRNQLGRVDLGLYWMRSYWSPYNPVWSLAAFCPGSRAAPLTGLAALPGVWWVAALLLWMVPCALCLIRSSEPCAGVNRTLIWCIGIGLLLPTLWSLSIGPIYVPGRVDFVLLPAFTLVAARGLGMLGPFYRRRWLAVIVGTCLYGLQAFWRETPVRQESAWTSILEREVRSGDALLCASITCPQSEYWVRNRRVALWLFPTQIRAELALFNEPWYLRHVDLRADAASVVSSASRDLRPGGSLWVVTMPSQAASHRWLLEALSREATLGSRQDYSTDRMGLFRLDLPVSLYRYERQSQEQPTGLRSATESAEAKGAPVP